MSELNCKGSFMLGSACGTCPKCVRNIAEIAKATPLGARIDKLEAALKEAVKGIEWCQKKSAHMKSDHASEINRKTTETLARIEEVLK